jgi:type II restriction/modification system DNA methylase subunit YeeA
MRHNVGGLSWEVTDKYGWPVEKDAIRDAKINVIIGESNTYEDCVYNISLSSKDHDMYKIILDLSTKKFDFYTLGSIGGQANKELRISFKCDSFSRADELIKLIMEGNNLELTPVSINK